MDCPYCSQPGAKRVLFKVRCPNAACPAYDERMAKGGAGGFSSGTVSSHSAIDPVAGSRDAASSTPRKPVSPAVSWILWIVAYALFRFGQHEGNPKTILWAGAAAIAVLAYLAGKRAAPVGAGAGDDEDDEDLAVLRRMERDEVEGPFDATGANAIEIRYRTARGEDKTFTGDRTSLRRRRAHVTVRVAPEGIRIALLADRIANRTEVEGAIPA